MSLEGLLKELEHKKAEEQERRLEDVREQYEKALQSKEQEISSLKEEIDTLRNWLDHSALPAFNPVSKRKDSMGLIKMNFNPDKPCPEMWGPGEKDLLESVPREREPASGWNEDTPAGRSLDQKPWEPLESRLEDSFEKPAKESGLTSFSAGHQKEEPGIEVELPKAELDNPDSGPGFELSKEQAHEHEEIPTLSPEAELSDASPKPAAKRPAPRKPRARPSAARAKATKKAYSRKNTPSRTKRKA